MADHIYYFSEPYYIRCKLAQLKSDNLTYTETSLKAAIANAYQQPYSEDLARRHYEDFGRSEGLNPNPYFNEYEYLLAKTRQLNSIGEANRYGTGPWTADDVLAAILEDDMIPVQHYEIYGCYEKDASGRFINPSNAFDANAYWSAKLFQLQITEPDAGWTMDSMIAAFKAAKLSPISHWAEYGWEEVTEDYAFVQTVPVGQRVSNDPARDDFGDIVPTNYMNNTPAPRDSNPRPAQKPADVGGLVEDEDISPAPLYPEKSAPVPGDDDYVAPPSTIQDGPEAYILPPATTSTGNASDHYIVVDNDSDIGVVIHRDTGAILGQVLLEKTADEDGNTVVTMPEEENRPVAWLDPVDPDELPPGVNPDPNQNNNFIPEPGPDPDPDPSGPGITAAFNADGDLIIGNTVLESGSTVTLDAEGAISDWTGHQEGALKPTAALAEGKTLYALNTTEVAGGTGELTLTSHKTAPHGIVGSEMVCTHIKAEDGARVTGISGGNADDTIHVAQGATVTGSINGNGGDDEIFVHGTAANIYGGMGEDKITVSGTADYIFGDNDDGTGDGNDVITIEDTGKVGAIYGGAGDDEIIVHGTAGTIYGDNDDGTGDGDDKITVSGTVGTIYGGGGEDKITIESYGKVTVKIEGGDGDDIITIESGAEVTGNIFGNYGKDIITVSGTVKGNILGGDENDVIILNKGAEVTGSVSGSSGDDTIILAGVDLSKIKDSSIDDDNGTNTLELAAGYGWAGVAAKLVADGFSAVTVAEGGNITGDISLGNVAATYTVESGGTVENIQGGSLNDRVSLHVGAKLGDGTFLNGGAGSDTLAITGPITGEGSLDLSGLAVTNFEILDLTAEGSQRVFLAVADLPTGFSVQSALGQGDRVLFAGLGTRKGSAVDVVNDTEWYYDSDNSELIFRVSDEQRTIEFEVLGTMSQYGDGAIWTVDPA